MKKKWLIIATPIILLLAAYFSGPKPSTPVFDQTMPTVPTEPAALEEYISKKESKHTVRPGNEAQIVWEDSSKKKTEYAVVYLHGFSASQMEGDPIHRRFAKEFGCNLFLARLADHGIDTTEMLLQFTADRFWESSKEALAIGKAIGEKVILVSTSTGGTTALMLAAEYPEDVHALINLSPNVALRDPAAFLLNDPWGLQIARMVMGGNYREWIPDEQRAKYWNSKYRLESLTQLEELVESSMNKELFSKVKQPSLTLFYYKNDEEQDPEVKVSAMLEMNKLIATPDSLKVTVPIPNAGAHVIGSSLVSKDVEGVYREMEKFAIDKLHLIPASFHDCPMSRIIGVNHDSKDNQDHSLLIESSDSLVVSGFEGEVEEETVSRGLPTGHIVIKMNDFTYIQYFGLKRIFYNPGNRIYKGATIGITGKSQKGNYAIRIMVWKRNSTGEELKTVDPNPYFKCK